MKDKPAVETYFTIICEPDPPALYVVYARGKRRAQFENFDAACDYVVAHGGEDPRDKR